MRWLSKHWTSLAWPAIRPEGHAREACQLEQRKREQRDGYGKYRGEQQMEHTHLIQTCTSVLGNPVGAGPWTINCG
jgi:hypothetical protein